MGNGLRQKSEYIILKSHEENGITIIEECKFTGIGIVEEAADND